MARPAHLRAPRYGALGPEPSTFALRATVDTFAVGLPTVARATVFRRERRWAHQDSNLERAGYEPAALTIELWARDIVALRCASERRPRVGGEASRTGFDMIHPIAVNPDIQHLIRLQQLDSEIE